MEFDFLCSLVQIFVNTLQVDDEKSPNLELKNIIVLENVGPRVNEQKCYSSNNWFQIMDYLVEDEALNNHQFTLIGIFSDIQFMKMFLGG